MKTGAHRISRRRLLGVAGLVTGGGALVGAALTASTAAAQAKVTQQLSNYQAKPNGDARCDGCSQWQAPSSCKVVQGEISPSGWCSLFVPKS